MAPAPITSRRFGTSVKLSASVLQTMVCPSNFAKGNSTGTLPVAITMFAVSIAVWPAPFLTETFPGAVMVPVPSKVVTLFVFISARTPPVSVFTTLSLR